MHRSLIVDANTTPTKIHIFLRSAYADNASHGKLHLRAYEEIHALEGGQPSTVKVLFLRSGSSNPFEWLAHKWNQKSQYALAAKVLQEDGQFKINATQPGYMNRSQRTASGKPEAGVTLSSLVSELVTCRGPVDTSSIAHVDINGPVRNQRTRHTGGERQSHAYINEAWKPRVRTFDSMELMMSAPSVKSGFGNFLGVKLENGGESAKNLKAAFKHFAALAKHLLSKQYAPVDYLDIIENSPNLTRLLKGALAFSQHWAKCWKENPKGHDTLLYLQVEEIDSFAIWMAKYYLDDQEFQILKELSENSPDASQRSDARLLVQH